MTTSDRPEDDLPEAFPGDLSGDYTVPDDVSSLSDAGAATPRDATQDAHDATQDTTAPDATQDAPDAVPAPAVPAPEVPAHAIAIILTQVATAEALAAACAVNKIVVDAVTSPVGAYAICRDTSEGAPAELARAVSALVKTVPLILFEAAGGQVKASQWQGGKRLGDMPAALVLDGAPHEFEDLLFGTTSVHDLPGVVSSAGMSRWKAMRTLSGNARKQRGGK